MPKAKVHSDLKQCEPSCTYTAVSPRGVAFLGPPVTDAPSRVDADAAFRTNDANCTTMLLLLPLAAPPPPLPPLMLLPSTPPAARDPRARGRSGCNSPSSAAKLGRTEESFLLVLLRVALLSRPTKGMSCISRCMHSHSPRKASTAKEPPSVNHLDQQ
jgi:hypothetical protein